MTHNEITKALKDLVPNAQFILTGEDYENIQWLDERAKPTVTALATAIANPLPEPEPTVAEKLASVGLSLEELRTALGSN
jgi:hypothetical protein